MSPAVVHSLNEAYRSDLTEIRNLFAAREHPWALGRKPVRDLVHERVQEARDLHRTVESHLIAA